MPSRDAAGRVDELLGSVLTFGFLVYPVAMTLNGCLPTVLYVGHLVPCLKPLGPYLARGLNSEPWIADPVAMVRLYRGL